MLDELVGVVEDAAAAGEAQHVEAHRFLVAAVGRFDASLDLTEEMAKAWVLDTDTKGTGAHVVPLEQALAQPKPRKEAPKRKRAKPPRPATPASRKRRESVEKTSGPLAPGHVRKKATGEIGKVQSVDSKAGTATVFWLRRGRASTVPLSAITRK